MQHDLGLIARVLAFGCVIPVTVCYCAVMMMAVYNETLRDNSPAVALSILALSSVYLAVLFQVCKWISNNWHVPTKE